MRKIKEILESIYDESYRVQKVTPIKAYTLGATKFNNNN